MSRTQVLIRVVGAHILFLLAVLLFPLIPECRWDKPDEEWIEVDLASLPELPEDSPEEDPEDTEAEPVEEEEVIPEATPEAVPTPTPEPQATPTPVPTPTPTPVPTPRPAPTPTPTPRAQLLTPEQIRARIEQQQPVSEPPPVRPTLSPQEIRDMIAEGLPAGERSGVTSRAGASGVSFASVSAELRARLISAWEQPSHLTGLAAVAVVDVQRDGRVTNRRIQRGSGNADFDRTVREALSKVSFAKPLPPEYDGTHRTIEIDFTLTP